MRPTRKASPAPRRRSNPANNATTPVQPQAGAAEAPVYATPGQATTPRKLRAVGAPALSRVRVPHLLEMKAQGVKITAVTCYDASFARLVDAAAIDVVLVGDSLGNVIQGQESTLPVTVDHIVYHTAAVSRGLRRAHLVADMPFMSYRSVDVALENAGRMLAQGGAHAVKLEGGAEMAPIVKALVDHGIPVMGHLGLTPQSVHAMGGHRVQGRGKAAKERLIRDALALQDAGCYAVVLELVPAQLALEVSQRLVIPTIGIGAGAGCDGQILVLYDLLGMNAEFQPKFLKRFADLHSIIGEALGSYRQQVQGGEFPGPEHAFVDPSVVAEARPPARAG